MEYVPVRVSTLRGEQKIDFDLFIHLRERYVLYIRQGDSFEGDRLDRLKAKKLRKMYITAESEESYRRYIDTNLQKAYDNNSSSSIEDRAAIVQGDQQANAEAVMEDPGDAKAYSKAKDGAAKYVDFLVNNTDGLKAVLDIENTDKDVGHHGVTVATLAVAMCDKVGITDATQKQMLSLGCILHDMGHLRHPVEFRRALEQFSAEELTKYKEHPTLGAEAVKDKKHFDQQIITIVMQHHEALDGSGYPLGLVDKKIDRLSLLCGVANDYDRLVTFEEMDAKEAIKKLMIDKVGRYPLEYLNALKAVLKEQSKI
ncbi:MAG: HD domain-containing phosphohydrolase [Bdellovibrionota bacterium]|nr:hypothetical protein [Pseudobdellovibrionaceae bacterium]|tara:strand:+ start:17839 stop:18777 length:939 start_codon:yes stop_codon:yes gene_type:complete